MPRLRSNDPTFIFFDGACATCHWVVRFLVKRRERQRFRFIALERLAGTLLAAKIEENLGVDLQSSIVVWKNGVLYARMEAALAIFSDLAWPWRAAIFLRILPLPWMNALYNLFARHRYQIFGKAREVDVCVRLPPELLELFPPSFPEHLPLFTPEARRSLTAQWRQLLIVNYRVPAESLAAYLPQGLELDLWQGEAFVSLVALRQEGRAVGGIRLPLCSDVTEISLRVCVRRVRTQEHGALPIERGSLVLQKLVGHRLQAWVAAFGFEEPCQHAELASSLSSQGNQTTLGYVWGRKGEPCTMQAVWTDDNERLLPEEGVRFFCERPFVFIASRDQKVQAYELEYSAWKTWTPMTCVVEGPWRECYPSALASQLRQVHSSVIAAGSAVRLRGC